MHRQKLQNVLIGMTAVVFAGSTFWPGAHVKSGPVATAAAAIVTGNPASTPPAHGTEPRTSLGTATAAALRAFSSVVRPLSRPEALANAFHAYFAFKAAHPDQVKKPYLYFVDYGLPSTAKRGYVFDMSALKVLEGPFTVAHGRGSSSSRYGVPSRFSNAFGAATSSLGLYVTKALYAFTGHTGGRAYSSIGLRLDGVSTGFNTNALARGVVAHGAPYVTPAKAGRSEGCPAMEPSRAKQLLPKLADGALVFLFAPDQQWLAQDPWVTAATE